MLHLIESVFDFAVVVQPRANVAPSAVLGKGSVVMAGAILGTVARLSVGSIAICGAEVDHHVTVKDYCNLGVNANKAGGTVLGRGACMQAGFC